MPKTTARRIGDIKNQKNAPRSPRNKRNPATGNTSAGRLRNAMPKPTARRIGNMKIQKIASGSRRKSRNRAVVNWYNELSRSLFIAQIPPRKSDKDILKRGGMGAKLAQVQIHSIECCEDERDRRMQFAHR